MKSWKFISLCVMPAAVNSHHLLPVPAYDVAGRLLTPTAYRRCLEGAIAEVHFTLLHRAIDAYGGHIVFIRVLSAAGRTPSYECTRVYSCVRKP
ncbi:hypothetical protein EV401DRAFT_1970065 [Pisolithus croceorrhizus]|nr:hypothetical protein EV401DRAFT_1970065 [Pisolithus croceorrhizus]